MIEDGYLRRKLAADPQVKAWVKRLLNDPEARPADLDDERLTFVHEAVMQRRRQDFSPSEYEWAMSETAPILAAPDITDWVEDLGSAFSQPEMLAFWKRWNVRDTPRKGPKPPYAQSKALLAVMAMAGISAHAEDAHDRLCADERLRKVFAKIDELASDRPNPFTTIAPYKTLMRLKERSAEGCFTMAMETNIAMVKALAELYPEAGIGKRLLIDGSSIPAWALQRGSGWCKTEEAQAREEAFLRRRCPQAGFRFYGYSGKGKEDITSDEGVKQKSERGQTKKWRGYLLVVIADQATGLPLVWQLHDAADWEPDALIPLLSDLHHHWRDIDAELIAGDSLYDNDESCAVCETNYGIHPVFRLHDDRGGMILEKNKSREKASRDGSVKGFTHEGQLICTRHGEKLEYEHCDVPNREGVPPGVFVDKTYRVRAECKHGPDPCGRIGLRMKYDWSKLTYYPHFKAGHEKRHAMRLAMLTRLKGLESIFSRVKGGAKLGTEGADRTRILEFETVLTLISLALLSMTAMTLADQRSRLVPVENEEAA